MSLRSRAAGKRKPTWRKLVFALSFVAGPAIGATSAGLFFVVAVLVEQPSKCCGVEDLLLGILLLGIFGAPVGLVVVPPLVYWYFLYRPYRSQSAHRVQHFNEAQNRPDCADR